MKRLFSEFLKSALDDWAIEYRVHATQRMFQRFIQDKDVRCLLACATIIEEYPTDFPFPSFLINGKGHDNRPLHAVVGVDRETSRLYLITIYEPDPEKWADDFSKRS